MAHTDKRKQDKIRMTTKAYASIYARKPSSGAFFPANSYPRISEEGVPMLNVICTFGGIDKNYSIFDFQKLPESEISLLRHSLVCPKCRGVAFYRKRSVDGKIACFGSRYCLCREGANITPRQRAELENASEVEQIIADSNTIELSYGTTLSQITGIESSSGANVSPGRQKENQKKHTIESSKKRVPKVALKKILHSLLLGTGLASSDTVISMDGLNYKAKNLFVKLPDAMPIDSNAQRFYWGTLYNSNDKIEWLNAAECKDVSIPLGNLRDVIVERFKITSPDCLGGAAIIFSGRCRWNKEKTKKIISIRDVERIYISLAD